MNSTSNVYVWRKKTKQKKTQKTENWEYSYYVEDKKRRKGKRADFYGSKGKIRSISPGGQPASRGKEGCPADQTQCILGCTQRLAPRWTSHSRLDLSAAYATLPWHHSCSRKQKGHSAAAWDTDVIQIKLNWSEKMQVITTVAGVLVDQFLEL